MTAKYLYSQLDEEFCKGSPNSDLNKKCKTEKDLIVYAMKEYAKLKCAEQREICANKSFYDEVPKILNAPEPKFD